MLWKSVEVTVCVGAGSNFSFLIALKRYELARIGGKLDTWFLTEIVCSCLDLLILYLVCNLRFAIVQRNFILELLDASIH